MRGQLLEESLRTIVSLTNRLGVPWSADRVRLPTPSRRFERIFEEGQLSEINKRRGEKKNPFADGALAGTIANLVTFIGSVL
jgi:hypothetical protein